MGIDLIVGSVVSNLACYNSHGAKIIVPPGHFQIGLIRNDGFVASKTNQKEKDKMGGSDQIGDEGNAKYVHVIDVAASMSEVSAVISQGFS